MAPKKTATNDPAGYAEAMREVEQILSELDSSSVDVDVLASKVERASFLITWCNNRIASAQMSIDTLVASIDIVDEDHNDFDDDEFEDDEDEDDE
jgi:exodeoxyribonuclease VII small subunit